MIGGPAVCAAGGRGLLPGLSAEREPQEISRQRTSDATGRVARRATGGRDASSLDGGGGFAADGKARRRE